MQLDYAAILDAVAAPHLVVDRDLRIRYTNAACTQITGVPRDRLVGQDVTAAFGQDLADPGVLALRTSLIRVITTGLPHALALQRFDVVDPVSGSAVVRYWSFFDVPVLDETGGVSWVLRRVEDVSAFAREHLPTADGAEPASNEAIAGFFGRGQELLVAWEAEAAAGRTLAALAETALQLNQAETVEALAALITERGLRALGATGGALGVTDGEVLRSTISSGLGADAQLKYAELPLYGPLPASVAAATGRRVLLSDLGAALAFAPEMAGLTAATGCQAWASLPLWGRDRILGALSVGWAEPHAFTADEIDVLEALAAQSVQGLERIEARRAELRSAAATYRMAETLQRSLLTDPLTDADLPIVVRYRPAAHEVRVGGDWYDAFRTADGVACLVIGDVAGHDQRAAAAMAQLRNLLRGIAYPDGSSPAAALSTLDRAIRDLDVGAIATIVLVRVDPDPDPSGGRTIRWSNAGHPPLLLLTPDGAARLLTSKADLLIGIDPDTERAEHKVVLAPGSRLLLFTDGLIERRQATIDDGLDWLVAAAGELAHLPLDALCDALLALVHDHAEDDVALLAMRVLGPGQTPS